MKPNRKSKQIILRAYWGTGGWRAPPQFSEEDIRHLRRTGYLFRGESLVHDEAVERLLQARDALNKATVVNAFVASLGSRELEYRSPLGSYAHALHLERHAFEPVEWLHSKRCAICGLPPKESADWPILNFEQLKWGGVRHDELTFQAFDLEQLSEHEPRVPGASDWKILAQILELASDSPQSVGSLKKAVQSVIKSNNAERDALCHILAYTGVLAPSDCPTFHHDFVRYDQRGDGSPKSDQRFPLSWWRGGINTKASNFWFPEIA